MSQDEAFVQAIRDAPADEAVRLIYADWLQDTGDAAAQARGQFIRSQCQREAIPDAKQRRLMESEEPRLLRDNWDFWLAPLRQAIGSMNSGQWLQCSYHNDAFNYFRRGFVEELTLPARTFLDRAEAIFRVTPLRDLTVVALEHNAVALGLCPWISELSRLSFADFYSHPLDASGAIALAASHHFQRLTTLSLQRNNIGNLGLEALASAEWLSRLTLLDLTDNGLSSTGLEALALRHHRPCLEILRLGNNFPGTRGVEALARAPSLAHLQSLDLSRCELTDREASILTLSSFLRRVRDIDLSRNGFGPDGRRILRESFGDRAWF